MILKICLHRDENGLCEIGTIHVNLKNEPLDPWTSEVAYTKAETTDLYGWDDCCDGPSQVWDSIYGLRSVILPIT